MALDRESWATKAESVPDGHSRRVSHDCGPGRTLNIERNGNEYRAWCFRCNEGDGFRVQPTMAEVTARLSALRSGDELLGRAHDTCVLPMPAVHDVLDWPQAHRLWLYKTGLGALEIARLGAYYHPPSDRVVLPVFRAGTRHPEYFQARALGRRQPKYLGSPVGRATCVPTWGAASRIVVTEDILSAFKIGLVAEAVCALGTSPTPALVRYLLESRKPIAVWLDPDAAGRRGASKLVKSLRAYGLHPQDIVSERDPKLHTLEQIKEILCTCKKFK